MPYIRIWIHLIGSTKDRVPLLAKELRQQVIAHIKQNAAKKEIYLDTINSVSDHVHALLSLRSDQTIAKLAQLLKGESLRWINEQNLIHTKFEWQDEYVAVSVSESMVDQVREYIKNQGKHHRQKSYAEEFQDFMEKYGFAIVSENPR